MTHTYIVRLRHRLAQGYAAAELVAVVAFCAGLLGGLWLAIRLRRLAWSVSVASGVRWQRFQGALAGYQHRTWVVPVQLWLAAGRPVGFRRPRQSIAVWLVRRWLLASGWLPRGRPSGPESWFAALRTYDASASGVPSLAYRKLVRFAHDHEASRRAPSPHPQSLGRGRARNADVHAGGARKLALRRHRAASRSAGGQGPAALSLSSAREEGHGPHTATPPGTPGSSLSARRAPLRHECLLATLADLGWKRAARVDQPTGRGTRNHEAHCATHTPHTENARGSQRNNANSPTRLARSDRARRKHDSTSTTPLPAASGRAVEQMGCRDPRPPNPSRLMSARDRSTTIARPRRIRLHSTPDAPLPFRSGR